MMQIILVGLGAGAAAALLFASVVSGSIAAVVLFYLAPLPILIAALGWSHLAGLLAAASATAVVTMLAGDFFAAVAVIAFGVRGIVDARNRGAFVAKASEQKFAGVGQMLRTATEPNGVVISGLHSGSIRFYAGRMTLRYDHLDSAVVQVEQGVPVPHGQRHATVVGRDRRTDGLADLEQPVLSGGRVEDVHVPGRDVDPQQPFAVGEPARSFRQLDPRVQQQRCLHAHVPVIVGRRAHATGPAGTRRGATPPGARDQIGRAGCREGKRPSRQPPPVPAARESASQ